MSIRSTACAVVTGLLLGASYTLPQVFAAPQQPNCKDCDCHMALAVQSVDGLTKRGMREPSGSTTVPITNTWDSENVNTQPWNRYAAICEAAPISNGTAYTVYSYSSLTPNCNTANAAHLYDLVDCTIPSDATFAVHAYVITRRLCAAP